MFGYMMMIWMDDDIMIWISIVSLTSCCQQQQQCMSICGCFYCFGFFDEETFPNQLKDKGSGKVKVKYNDKGYSEVSSFAACSSSDARASVKY